MSNGAEVKKEIITLHNEVLYPTVRVTTMNTGGSGTVLYSKKNGDKVVTMIMTNHHVIEECIKVEDKWDPRIGEDRKREFKQTVHVEYFKYNNYSRCIGSFSVEADIVAYDEDQDIALLMTRDKENLANSVANIYPKDAVEDIHIFDPIVTVGAALGEAPLPTTGQICFMDKEIDNFKYWLLNSNGIYGISGGATFRYSSNRDKYEYIGIPSVGEVIMLGFSPQAITYMCYIIPIDRIFKFLDDHCYQFIYDEKYTIEQCDKNREEIRQKEEKKIRRVSNEK